MPHPYLFLAVLILTVLNFSLDLVRLRRAGGVLVGRPHDHLQSAAPRSYRRPR